MDEGSKEYDVVLDVLQKYYDALWKMTQRNTEWGIMDQIRLEQMDQLQQAIILWQQHKEKS